MKKKITALLAILLLVSLVGCGNNIDNTEPTPSDATPTETTVVEPSTEPTQKPTSEPSAEPTTTPTQEPTTEPTDQSKETTPPTTESTPKATQEPTIPSSTPTPTIPAHTHNYTSSITTQATCGTDDARTYTCSCGDSYTEAIKATGNHNYNSTITKQPNCAEEGTKSNTCATCGYTYTEAIVRTDHNWATRHIDEVGHMESSGTYKVEYRRCDCGFSINTDEPNAEATWKEHTNPLTGCLKITLGG